MRNDVATRPYVARSRPDYLYIPVLLCLYMRDLKRLVSGKEREPHRV